MAKGKRKPRKNAGKVISLAAFRKKKAEIEESEPDLRPTPMPEHMVGRGDVAKTRSHREMRERGELWWQGGRPGGPTTPEEADERLAEMKDAMLVKRNLTRLLKVTQGIFSPSTVKRMLPNVADYDDDTLRSFAFESTEKEWLEKPSFFRAVMREAANRWGMRAPPKDNPNTTEHREGAAKLLRKADLALKAADRGEILGRPSQEQLDTYLNALVWAMMSHQEAEHGEPKKSRRKGARRVGRQVRRDEERALEIATRALVKVREIVRTAENRGRGKSSSRKAAANPANIPGGNMTECIAIMEARGDVESPGALCNWLSKKAGEPSRGRSRSSSSGTAKARAILRRAMRGT